MKIRFQKSEHVQKPVQPRQKEMAEARSRKLPVLGTLVVVTVIAVAAFTAYRISRSGNIYTYGVIHSQLQEVRVPSTGVVHGITVKRGDRVRKGAKLFTLRGIAEEKVDLAARRFREALERKSLLEAEKLAGGRREAVRLALAEKERAEARFDNARALQESRIRKAEIEVRKLQAFYNNKRKRFLRLQELMALDAAVLSSVETGRNAMELALRNLEQAREDLAAAKNTKNPYALERENARIALSEIRAEPTAGLSEAELSRLDLEIARSEPVEITFHAAVDGVVTLVAAVDGAQVMSRDLVVAVEERSAPWLDLYVSGKYAETVTRGAKVIAFLPGSSNKFTGTVVSEQGLAVRLPASLKDKIPGAFTVYLFRADLGDDTGLVPGNLLNVVVPGVK